MSERYERLLKFKDNLYAEGSPVIIEAGALLKDTLTNKVIVQLKFLNLGEKQIDFLTVKLTTYDPQGNKNSDIVEYQYMDLKAKKNYHFGEKTPIVLEDNTVRNIDVSVSKIIFSDKTTQELSEKFEPVEESESLQKKLCDDELVKQYRIETHYYGVCVPKRYMDLFCCDCGTINKTEICRKCERNINQKIEAFDIEELKNKRDIRIKQEKEEAEAARKEDERKEEERRIAIQETKKKLIKIAKVVVPIVVAVIAFLIILFTVIIPNVKYNNAVNLMNDKKYEDAITAFESLNGYKDSNEKISSCSELDKEAKYNNAVNLMNDGKYSEAVAVFETMNGYKDSNDKLSECKYNNAVSLINEGKYQEAYGIFSTLDYKDSKEYLRHFLVLPKNYSEVRYVCKDNYREDKSDHNYAYDEKGNLTSEKDGSDIKEYTYDEKGNLTSEKHGSDIKEYTYDEKGNCIAEKHNYNKYFGTTTEYTYNEKGNRATEKKTYSDGTEGNLIEYTYDEKGNRIAYKETYPNGKVGAFTEYTYDEKGNRIAYKSSFEGVEDQRAEYTYTYNEKNQLIEKIRKDPSRTDGKDSKIHYEYNENGMCIKTVEYKVNGDIVTSTYSDFICIYNKDKVYDGRGFNYETDSYDVKKRY